jgi:hypothetical protein
MSQNGGRLFGEGALDPRIQQLTDDLAIWASIVFAAEWVMPALEKCAASEAESSGLVFGNLTVLLT